MVEYINRKNRKYYLHAGKTKTGKPKYYFSRKKDGNLADSIPAGFEVYESPAEANVYLRKIKLKLVSDIEIAMIESAVKKYSKVECFRIDVKEKSIIIYTTDQSTDRINDMVKSLGGFFPAKKMVDFIGESSVYSPVMRFNLEDEKERRFTVERRYFTGTEGWLYLSSSKDLKSLAEKYCKHLGRDSFYELM